MSTRRPRTSIVPLWTSSAPKIARAVSVLPGPHEAGDAEDLALAKLEADVSHQLVPRSACSRAGRPAHSADDVALGLGLLVDDPPDHHVDDLLLGDLSGLAACRPARRRAGR